MGRTISTQNNLEKKKKVGKLTVPCIKSYCYTTGILTRWHCCKGRGIDQNRTEFRIRLRWKWPIDFWQRFKDSSMKKGFFFQQMVLKQIFHAHTHTHKNEPGSNLTSYTEINLNFITGLNVKPKTTKIWEERIGESYVTYMRQKFFCIQCQKYQLR